MLLLLLSSPSEGPESKELTDTRLSGDSCLAAETGREAMGSEAVVDAAGVIGMFPYDPDKFGVKCRL